MCDLPSALSPPAAQSIAHPRLHRRMVLVHPCEAPEPVRQSQVAAHDDAEVPCFCPEGVREVRQARIQSAAEGICTSGLERRFHIEENDIAGIVGHDSV